MTGADLLALIPPEEMAKYYEPIPFQDSKPGFSIKRHYSKDIPYHPPLNKLGDPDTSCMIRIMITEENGPLKNFRCDVSKFSHSGYHHFHFDEEAENDPSKDELEKSQKTPQPIDLDYRDPNMVFNPEKNIFILDYHNYSLSELLDFLFNDHCNSTKLFSKKRIKYKYSKHLWNFKHTLLDVIIPLLKWVLEGFGRSLGKFEYPGSLMFNNSEIDMSSNTENDMNVLGYKISKTGMVLFSSLVVILYCCAKIFNLKSVFIIEIFNNPFLTIVFSVVGLWTIDEFLPNLIYKLFLRLIDLKRNNWVFRVHL